MIKTQRVKLKFALPLLFSLIAYSGYLFVLTQTVLASDTSNFTQTISAGSLDIDIVDDSYVTVGSPSVAMSTESFSFACQSSTGTFGTATEQVLVTNPDAADGGWTASIGAGSTAAVWDSDGTDFDFNDAAGSGCTDGEDADSVAGQMTVDPTGGSIAAGPSGASTSNISVGSSAAFDQGTVDSITIFSGSADSADIGDWTLQGVSIIQTIPASQPAAADYDINMTVSVVASG